MSNMGDMGDMGDMGNLGRLGSVAGSLAYPDRVDLPLTTEAARVWEEVGGVWQWTPTGADVDTVRFPNAAWDDDRWGPNWAAWRTVSEFAETDWKTSVILTLWNNSAGAITTELNALVRAAQDERPDALGEIIAQNANYEGFMAYFLALLGIDARTHPRTVELLHIAGLVGIVASMHFKANPGNRGIVAEHPRPRPSTLLPALLPPIEVPAHPSFPSGHATQAMLMAMCATEALPAAARATWRPLLHTLAGRIARNREIAGLHYGSDTNAGLELAAKVFGVLTGTRPAPPPPPPPPPLVPRFQDVLGAARNEWV